MMKGPLPWSKILQRSPFWIKERLHALGLKQIRSSFHMSTHEKGMDMKFELEFNFN
jgi:hypothetical protein